MNQKRHPERTREGSREVEGPSLPQLDTAPASRTIAGRSGGQCMILAGDIGGTNCRLAIFDEDGQTIVRQQVYQTAAGSRFEDVAREFLTTSSAQRIDRACFGVAGPVREGRVTMTNQGWTLDEQSMSRELKIPRVALINDMVAHAENIPNLKPDQLITLRPGKAVHNGGGAIIIPGTGLGQGGLFYDRTTQKHRGFATEGGHSDFAPSNEREDALLHFVRQQSGPISWEAVVSGPGLRTLYDFLGASQRFSSRRSFEKDEPRPRQITEAAADGSCELCIETARLFVELLGAEAGNLALKTGATAGIWLGGGIAETLIEFLRSPAFFNRLQSKGQPPIREMLSQIPVHLIRFELNGLYGAASFARGM